MNYLNGRLAPGPVIVIAALLIAACGGEQTVASKSAAAFREAQKKGTPVGGDGHGGHSASAEHGATKDTTMTGMDHSTMTGMDHSQMKPGQSMAGMDHSQMKPGQSMAGMDHSQMKPGQSMAGMDHSQMKPGQSMAGMGHSQMKPGQSMAGMDHSQMKPGQPMAGMDHSKMQGGQPMAGMDHSQMQPAQQPMAGIDHSKTPGMQQPSPALAVKPPTTTAEVQRLRPSSTLQGDEFDAPAAAAVSEARKASQSGGHEGMEMRGITPGQDRENPPTPAPAFRDGPAQGVNAAPAMDHTSHGQTVPVAPGQSAPAPAVDHSQHGQTAPATRPNRTATPQAAPAAATVYTCPMHPEVTSDKPGTCPKCGMALVKKK
jgi:hypothetical protein